MSPRPASIKVRALQWLAQREHSRVELRDKLLRLLSRPDRAAGVGLAPGAMPDPAQAAPIDPAAQVEALLQWLEARGYLSQERFTESRVHARQARFGNLRIRQELQQHGIRLDAQAQQALQRTEMQRAREVWRKKYDQPAVDAVARVRQMRFLAGRGFSMDVVRRIVLGSAGSSDEGNGETS